MNAAVCSGYDLDEILSQIDHHIESGLRPSLAIVFCSPVQDSPSLCTALLDRGLSVVGATTAGEIAGAEVLEGGCTVMLWASDLDHTLVWGEARADGESMEAVAERLGRAAADRFADPVVFVFASGLATDGESVVRGLERGAGGTVPLYGGLAADDMRVVETRVFADGSTYSDGIAALVLDRSRYHVEGLVSSGWEGVGIAKTVTRSEGNVVYELDGECVLDVYSQYFDLGDLRSGDVNVTLEIGVQYPLSVGRDDGTTVIRAPLMADPEAGSLIFAGGVPEGARVRFCIPPSLDIVQSVMEEAGVLRTRSPEADAVVLVSCKARHTALGPIMQDEIEGLHEVWDAPMAGYFSYGEIGGPAGACDFHNETCTLVTVRERA